jgi:SPX domain protein involved in polyphosphate accumulation
MAIGDVKYRPRIRRIIEEQIDQIADLVKIDIATIAERTDTARSTIYSWLNADVDDPKQWLTRYDPNTEFKLRAFFSKLLEKDIQIIERMKHTEDGWKPWPDTNQLDSNEKALQPLLEGQNSAVCTA